MTRTIWSPGPAPGIGAPRNQTPIVPPPAVRPVAPVVATASAGPRPDRDPAPGADRFHPYDWDEDLDGWIDDPAEFLSARRELYEAVRRARQETADLERDARREVRAGATAAAAGGLVPASATADATPASPAEERAAVPSPAERPADAPDDHRRAAAAYRSTAGARPVADVDGGRYL